MERKSKIVRVKHIHGHDDKNSYYEYELMPFSEWIRLDSSTTYGLKSIRYPYKWYSIKVLWEIPTYLLLRYSTKQTKQITNKQPFIIIKAMFSIMEIVLTIVGVYQLFQ